MSKDWLDGMSSIKKKPCVLCGTETQYIYTAGEKYQYFCCECVNAITMQNIKYLVNQDMRGD